MRTLGRRKVPFVNCGIAARPNPSVAGTSVAFAGEAAPATVLNEILGAEDIHVGQLITHGAIEPGHPQNDPGAPAQRLREHHTHRGTYAEPFPTSK
ncbi:hypothetical protein [Arthrobacter sp. UYCu512]|uniref:hypothetical protein n=1 Tax=Arthrobacter sp. UYCu512 TaxID=3156338 RepID=UPI003396E322